MHTDLTAVILAAGEGRRLEPLTNRRPKPMLPVGDKPLVEHTMLAAKDAGITEFVFVVGYERDRIQTHFGDGDRWGVSISYAVQRKQLGTAHALNAASELVGDRFVVLNGDRIIEPSIVSQVCETIDRGTATAAVAVTRLSNASSYGVVGLDGDRVTNIVEKPTESTSDIINAGVYAFDRSIFEAIDQIDSGVDGEYKLTDAINALADEQSVAAVRYDGWWLDVSYPWDLLSVTGRILDRAAGNTVDPTAQDVASTAYVADSASIGPNTVVGRGCAIGENVRIGPNATIEQSVVFPDATIGAGAVVKDCIVGANASIGANSTVPSGEATMIIDGELHENVRFGGVVGDNATVGGAAVLAAGTVLGDEVTVGPGASVSGAVDDGVEIRRS